MTVAVGFSLIAIVLFLAAGEKEVAASGRTLTGVIATYCIAGLLIGAIGGVLTPLMRSTIGFTVGAGFLGALTYLPFLVQESGPLIWRHFEWPLAGIFALMGVGTGFFARARVRDGGPDNGNDA